LPAEVLGVITNFDTSESRPPTTFTSI